MVQPESILATIYRCIDTINKQLPDGEKLATEPSTVLIGDQGRLDSLGLVMLISDIEQELANCAIHCELLDEVVGGDATNEDWTVDRLHRFIMDSVTQPSVKSN